MVNNYQLPKLKYSYQDLAPFLSSKLLTLHHQKHHQAYVNGANALLEKLNLLRKENQAGDLKAIAKEFSFHLGGHILHSLYWENLISKGKEITSKMEKTLNEEFTSFSQFKKEFSQVALSVEGSGWAVLAYDQLQKKLILMSVEKHNLNLIPGLKILLVLDVWEHAYYLDYQNDRAKYIETFWSFVDWEEVTKRFNKN